MKSLLALVNELENKLPFIELKYNAISKVSIGWHLEHSLLALIKMITAVEHSNPADYKREFNLKRLIVFLALAGVPKKIVRRCCVLCMGSAGRQETNSTTV